MNTEETTPPAVVLSTAQLDAVCRDAFVKYMKAEQEHRDPVYRMSLEAHRRGKQYGFYSDGTQAKWLDYKAAWFAGRASNAEISARRCDGLPG